MIFFDLRAIVVQRGPFLVAESAGVHGAHLFAAAHLAALGGHIIDLADALLGEHHLVAHQQGVAGVIGAQGAVGHHGGAGLGTVHQLGHGNDAQHQQQGRDDQAQHQVKAVIIALPRRAIRPLRALKRRRLLGHIGILGVFVLRIRHVLIGRLLLSGGHIRRRHARAHLRLHRDLGLLGRVIGLLRRGGRISLRHSGKSLLLVGILLFIGGWLHEIKPPGVRICIWKPGPRPRAGRPRRRS